MEYGTIIRDALLTTVLAICAERVVNKIKKCWYREVDVDINDIKINFIPETTDEEKILIIRKGHKPEIFKYFSDVN